MIHHIVFVALICSVLSVPCSAQDSLYTTAFGNSENPAVVFVHGGPGYNSTSFELAAAQQLAAAGLYVLVYDQRGCGRSEKFVGSNENKGSYSFETQCTDLISVMDKYRVQSATLIGHSWGGTLATQCALRYPKRVRALLFVGSPLSYQMSFRTIITRCANVYSAKNDSVGVAATTRLLTADTTALFYATECFMHAMKCGLYNAKAQSEEAKQFYAVHNSSAEKQAIQKMTMMPTMGAFGSERYTMLNLYHVWKNLSDTIPIWGLYGAEDGLFDDQQKALIAGICGKGRYHELQQCGHNVFIDQTTKFVKFVKEAVGE